MAFGKKKHRGLKRLLLFLLFFLILGGGGASGYMLYNAHVSEISAAYEEEIETLQLDAYALKRTVLMSREKMNAGTVLQKEQLYTSEISASLVQNQFMTHEDIGKVLLVDVEPDVPIMRTMLFEEIIGKDTREEELNMIFLPTNLEMNRFVDVRIGFPNGEDFIVLTKMKVRGCDLSNNMLWLWMEEKEILTLSSAIVDAYLHKGTKLYTVTYVAPTVQDEAIANYPVNTDVLKIIQENPNILAEAKQGLTADMRKLLDSRLSALSEEATSSVDQGIKKEISDRQVVVGEKSNNPAAAVIENETVIEPVPTTPELQESTKNETEGGNVSELY